MKPTKLTGALLLAACINSPQGASARGRTEQPAALQPAPRRSASGREALTRAGAREALRRLGRRTAGEPTVAKVQQRALRLALADAGRARRWLRRARSAAWLPKLQVGVGGRRQRDEGLDREPGSPDRLAWDARNQITYDIKLSWDLHRLIFDPNELKVVREAQRIAELRDQIITQVTRLYFERRRLQLRAALRAGSVADELQRELQIAEVTAALNGLTGGLFARSRVRSSARAPR